MQNNGKIPQHTYTALKAYVEDRLRPGSFLESVLCNDLQGACFHADSINQHFIYELVAYCYEYIPFQCWGSEEAYTNWLQEKENK